MKLLIRFLLLILLACLNFQVQGQPTEGFEKLYSDYIDGFGSDLVEVTDGYLVTGTKVSKESGITKVNTFLRKIDQQGEVLFDKLIPVEANAKIYPQVGGNILVNGRKLTQDWREVGQLLLLDAEGNTIWAQDYFQDKYRLVFRAHQLFELDTSYLIVTMRYRNALSLVEIAKTGELLATKNIFLDQPILLEAATKTSNGIAVVGIEGEAASGQFFPPTSGKPFLAVISDSWNLISYKSFEKEGAVTSVICDKDDNLFITGTDTENQTAIVRKLSLTGEILWERALLSNLSNTLESQSPPKAWDIAEESEFLYVTGNIENSDFLVKLDKNGIIDQDFTKFYPWNSDLKVQLIATSNTFVILGSKSEGDKYYTYIIAGEEGTSRLNRIEGKVLIANAEECIGEESVAADYTAIISATDEKGGVIYAETEESTGYFYFVVDTGKYEIQLESANDETRDSSCSEIPTIIFEEGGEFSTHNIVVTDEIMLFDLPPTIEDTKFKAPNSSDIRSKTKMLQVVPNPIKNQAKILINVPNQPSTDLELTIYNQMGQAVKILKIAPNSHEVIFDNPLLANGLYLFVLQAKGETINSKKVILAN